ncbi:hypothetical protein TraAM80_02883 [Trypanosoma rangeli]|uniref:Uncharacterized protein n=1 Tax=Trypanosoma rangeli TaxID=5698 RepID=A0A3R7NL71_TRYRA|nr:uncharacterized protein TraAM80_02883 [Trypanosoma rangeli]RNF08126.1 hypothetical protein TraAM80_02883 [Trypanosoma rangeli]|eukprot:RNF08126.1 hypothetical protein TraAM80_02883 [Trypanosoma rangeli]
MQHVTEREAALPVDDDGAAYLSSLCDAVCVFGVDDALSCEAEDANTGLTGSQKQQQQLLLLEEEEEEMGEEEDADSEEKPLEDEDEEYEEEYQSGEEDEGEPEETAEEEPEEEDEYGLELPSDEGKDPKHKKEVFFIQGRNYPVSALVKNAGLRTAQKKLRRNPKTTLMMCSLLKAHNVMECRFLHLTNRALLVGDRYVRINMLLDNPARVAVLKDPVSAAEASFCAAANGGHDTSVCSALHLLPGVVFVGDPRLRVGYFENELHDNVALKRLKADADSCGRWCRSKRSHVVVTCASLHYNRGKVYTEVPREPAKPLAVIPSLRPQAPRPAGGRGGHRCPSRGRGGGGRGRGRGGGGGGRGRGASHSRGQYSAVGRAPRPGLHATSATPALADRTDRDSRMVLPMDTVTPLQEEKVQVQKERVLNLILALLVFIVALLAYLLN